MFYSVVLIALLFYARKVAADPRVKEAYLGE
jgi:Branched-chain amino acid ATP-binding cassette transporter